MAVSKHLKLANGKHLHITNHAVHRLLERSSNSFKGEKIHAEVRAFLFDMLKERVESESELPRAGKKIAFFDKKGCWMWAIIRETRNLGGRRVLYRPNWFVVTVIHDDTNCLRCDYRQAHD